MSASTIDGLSAHADRSDMLRWIGGFDPPPQQTYIVHGEPPAITALTAAIRGMGWPCRGAEVPAADFSRDVLQRACDLDVVEMTDCGWDDWGLPARVLRSLGDTAAARAMRARLASCQGGDRIAEVAA